MLKLYCLYLVLGGFLALKSLDSWVWSNDCNTTVSLVALIASCTLYFIVTGIVLHNVSLGLRIGLGCLICLLPFAIFWINFYFERSWPLNEVALSREVLVGGIVYMIVIFYTIKSMVKIPTNIVKLNRSFTLIMTCFPLIVFAAYVLYICNYM